MHLQQQKSSGGGRQGGGAASGSQEGAAKTRSKGVPARSVNKAGQSQEPGTGADSSDGEGPEAMAVEGGSPRSGAHPQQAMDSPELMALDSAAVEKPAVKAEAAPAR